MLPSRHIQPVAAEDRNGRTCVGRGGKAQIPVLSCFGQSRTTLKKVPSRKATLVRRTRVGNSVVAPRYGRCWPKVSQTGGRGPTLVETRPDSRHVVSWGNHTSLGNIEKVSTEGLWESYLSGGIIPLGKVLAEGLPDGRTRPDSCRDARRIAMFCLGNIIEKPGIVGGIIPLWLPAKHARGSIPTNWGRAAGNPTPQKTICTKGWTIDGRAPTHCERGAGRLAIHNRPNWGTSLRLRNHEKNKKE